MIMKSYAMWYVLISIKLKMRKETVKFHYSSIGLMNILKLCEMDRVSKGLPNIVIMMIYIIQYSMLLDKSSNISAKKIFYPLGSVIKSTSSSSFAYNTFQKQSWLRITLINS